MNESRWRRRISPMFLILLVVAGLVVGFVAYVALTTIL